MHMRTSVVTLLTVITLTMAAAVHAQAAREEGRLLYAGQVLHDLRSQRDQAIPDRLLERASQNQIETKIWKMFAFSL